jgi:O-antigen ligase
VEIIRDYPLTGVGIGDNLDVFKKYAQKMKRKPDPKSLSAITKNHFHNQYLQILTETGLIGFTLFLLMVFYFHFPSDKIFSTLFIILFFTGFLAEPFLRNQFSSLLFCLFTGFIYNRPEPQ